MPSQRIPSRLRDVIAPALAQAGIIGATELHVVGRSTSPGSPSQYWNQWAGDGDHYHENIQTAYDLMQGGRNEVILITPESHSRSAVLTFDENMVHVVGMYGKGMQNQRSRIGHSVTLEPFVNVSGQGSTFHNLYFQYGLGNSTDTTLMRVTGNRNSFSYCHFLPTNATPLDESDYKLIDLRAAETYFDHCYFGGDTVAWTNGDMISFHNSSEPPRAVFEDCVFVMNADDAQVNFLSTVAGLGRCTIVFKRCLFLNLGTTIDFAIDGAGLGNAKMIFDINCTFAGVTAIVAAAKESSVWWGHGGYVSADKLNNLIATNPDVS